MLSKSRMGHVRSLHHRKYRSVHREFIAEGPRIAGEVMTSGWEITGIYAVSGWNPQHGIPEGTEIIEVTAKELQRISTLKTPQEVLLTMRMPGETIQIPTAELILLLDRIADPGNLGTIIRTADWFGIREIVCSADSADLYNPKVIQATMGSFLRTRVLYSDLPTFIRQAGYTVYGATMDGEPVYGSDIAYPAAVVIGNESTGISKDVLELLDRKVTVPRFGMAAESLNASVAAAIMMSEFKRRHYRP